MDHRSSAQIREHYEIEKKIAARLRNSGRAERLELYSSSYDELYRLVPHHLLLNGIPAAERNAQVAKEVIALKSLVSKDTVLIEIGPGDCAVSKKMSEFVSSVRAFDVSKEVASLEGSPTNFELMVFDGINISMPPESVDVAYSNQLMEHLHPDDSRAQLRSIFESLKKQGVYYCITPNRLSGPHDISRNFDPVATGLHLMEYTVTDLDKIFKETGFTKTEVYLRFSRFNFKLPLFPFKIAEALLGSLPFRIRKLVTFNRAIRFALGVKLLATK